MNSRERWALAALAVSAAVAGSAAVLALDAYGVLPLQIQLDQSLGQGAATASVKIQGRLISTGSVREPALRVALIPKEAAPVLRGQVDETSDAGPPAEERPAAELAREAALEADASEGLDSENADTWSSETHRAAKAPAPAAQRESLPWKAPAANAPVHTYTLAERMAQISPGANKRLAEKFEAAKAAWPPAEIGLVAIKDQKVLELFARSNGGEWTFVHRYKVLAASGTSGPKLRQGDKQVPEGVYGISFLNPNSRYHVSLRVDYPNAFDRQMATKDGRKQLGGDIMIHGKTASVGCLAIGDEAAEELFVAAANIGLPKVKLIIAPTDFRRDGVPAPQEGQPAWVPKLYSEVATAMAPFKAPPESSLLSFIFGN